MNIEDLIELKVLGITRSEVQPGAYALLLENADSTPDEARRIPIVVGAAEAQSIAVNLEQVAPSRPLTHDLFVSLFHVYGIELQYVTIYSFKDGVFAAMLHMNNGTVEVDIDSRTSSLLHSPTNDSRTHARMISAHTHACASIICLSLRKSPISVCGSQPSVSATLIFQSLRWGLES